MIKSYIDHLPRVTEPQHTKMVDIIAYLIGKNPEQSGSDLVIYSKQAIEPIMEIVVVQDTEKIKRDVYSHINNRYGNATLISILQDYCDEDSDIFCLIDREEYIRYLTRKYQQINAHVGNNLVKEINDNSSVHNLDAVKQHLEVIRQIEPNGRMVKAVQSIWQYMSARISK